MARWPTWGRSCEGGAPAKVGAGGGRDGVISGNPGPVRYGVVPGQQGADEKGGGVGWGGVGWGGVGWGGGWGGAGVSQILVFEEVGPQACGLPLSGSLGGWRGVVLPPGGALPVAAGVFGLAQAALQGRPSLVYAGVLVSCSRRHSARRSSCWSSWGVVPDGSANDTEAG
jgi:hypothetical protein